MSIQPGGEAAASTENTSAFTGEASQFTPTVTATAPAVVTTTSTNGPTTTEALRFTEVDLSKARQQEKDKLYPKLTKMEEELKELRKEREDSRLREEAAKKAEEDAAKHKAEEEMDVRQLLQAKEKEWREQLAQERAEREQAMALLDQERRYAQVQNYRLTRIEQERDNIIPELLDMVSGSTNEEIDASIAGLIDRSARIINAVAASSQTRGAVSGVRVTAPSTGPLENSTDQRTFTPEQIRDMSPSEYAKYREALGIGGSGKGLFG